jgi:hypothetical protein
MRRIGGVLRADVPGQTEDQRPGQLRGRRRPAARARHGDAELAGRRDVDVGGAHPGADQQPQPGEPFRDLTREPGALAHRDDHVERCQPLDERVGAGHVVVEDRDVGGIAQLAPRPELAGRVLVIIEHPHQQGRRGHADPFWVTG